MNLRTSADKRFRLEVAEQIATALVEKLAPFCAECSGGFTPPQDLRGDKPRATAIAVAGSIRRRRPDVGDIDLVAIPRSEVRKSGLFEETPVRPRDSRLAMEFCALLGKLEARGDAIMRGDLDVRRFESENVRTLKPSNLPTIGVDLYLCSAETWATTLLIRTGSAAHNIWLCSRARELGGKLHAGGEGLELPGKYDPRIQRSEPSMRALPKNEGGIFWSLLREEYIYRAKFEPRVPSNDPVLIPPELREIVNGRPAWLSKGDN